MKIAGMRIAFVVSGLFASGFATAEMMDRPSGIKIGERMTLRPYVALSASYDSNVNGRKNGSDDIAWVVNPGLGLQYKAETWSVLASAYYRYHAYTKSKNIDRNNNHTFGESLTYDWTDSMPGERGWTVRLTEMYKQINEIEDMTDSVGHDYSRDRWEFTGAAAVQRRFGSGLHADINGSYYWLDYKNKNYKDIPYALYGWDRWTVGAEMGYAPTKWTDFLIAGSYQGYTQENRRNSYYSDLPSYRKSNETYGYTLQTGIGSYATEKITYRFLGGWSRYEYKSHGKTSNGFTYSASANWLITDTWRMSFLASSAYQPTEREFGSSQRVDSLGLGVAHAMVQGKLNGTFDVSYRREGRENKGSVAYDYDLDIMTYRLGLTYVLNRYLQFFTNFEYRQSMTEGSSKYGRGYDYSRFRGTLGLRLTY